MAKLGFSLELRALIIGASLAWMTAGAMRDYQQAALMTQRIASFPSL